VLKTQQFNVRRNLGSPITVVRTYNTRNVYELIILDIDASRQGRCIDLWTISDVTEDCFMPLTIGGGIITIDDIRDTLRAGADKVAINTQALMRPHFIRESSEQFGRQCIVVSIDYTLVEGVAWVFNRRIGQQQLRLLDWAQEVVAMGAGELLINCVDRDGMMQGPDLTTIALLRAKIVIPIIYAGGVGQALDCADIIQAGAHAVAVSSVFHFTSITPDDCKAAMAQRGILVR
jgi:cyclase